VKSVRFKADISLWEQIKIGCMSYWLSALTRNLLILTVCIFFFVAVIVTEKPQYNNISFGVVFIVLGMWLYSFIRCTLSILAKYKLRKKKGDYFVTLDEKGYSVTSGETSILINWDNFRKFSETNNFFFLRTKSGDVFTLSKKNIGDSLITDTREVISNIPLKDKNKPRAGKKYLLWAGVLLAIGFILLFLFYFWSRIVSTPEVPLTKKFWLSALENKAYEKAYAHITEDFKNRLDFPAWRTANEQLLEKIGTLKEYELSYYSRAHHYSKDHGHQLRTRVDAKIMGDRGSVYIRTQVYKTHEDWLVNGFEVLYPVINKQSYLTRDDIEYLKEQDESGIPKLYKKIPWNIKEHTLGN